MDSLFLYVDMWFLRPYTYTYSSCANQTWFYF